MLRFLIHLLFGYYSFSVETACAVRIINQLQREDISFWNPKISDVKLRFCCMKRSGPRVCRLLSDMGIADVRIRSFGLPFLLSTLPRKILFWSILILSIAMPLIFHRFLVEINVSGNRSVESREILRSLEEVGIKPYAYIPHLELKYGRQHLLLQQPKLSWATLNLQGNTLEVIVHEKSGSQVVLPTDPCNIIAAFDGMVCRAEVLAGKQLVKENTAVRKGQLLVSGFSETETGHLSYLHAQAVVIAQIELQKSYTVDLAAKDYHPLDEEIVRYEWTVFGRSIPLYSAMQLPKQPYTVLETEKKAVVFGVKLPFGYKRRVYTLYEETEAFLTKTDAMEILDKRFSEYERYELEHAVIVAKEHRVEQQGSKITMTGFYLVQTDIAQKIPITVIK